MPYVASSEVRLTTVYTHEKDFKTLETLVVKTSIQPGDAVSKVIGERKNMHTD